MPAASPSSVRTGLPVSRQVLADHVYEALLEWLMDGRLEPGAAVSIDGMARELEVSPTPVREALARLEHTGMVRRVALKGYRVAPVFTREDFAELMEARLSIEPVNARLACSRMTPDGLAALKQAVEDLRTAPRGGSFAEYRSYLEADERFHQLIAAQASNQFLLAAYNTLGGQIQRFRLFGGVGITDAEQAIAEHQAVLDALLSGDPEAAATAMTKHVENVRGRAMADAPED
ncbi:GntR family transcriptional regulator [Arthrobacter sp. TES]|uniref:GntR family transcriptional regulator n=1 Tax=Paenarthrobacter ureafaciens TaxID=37931 RepID=A0AAX3ELA5_PAEUR|nr:MULTISPECIES: GntR family transcriptional regulator [Paenarthrobacter]AMB39617.1 GntR family transcriptional regulator [Arthrobacter sp. ATCC 21022]AOY72430.1 GntR family transcriptional regulator [Arthrobacter sp. ZXY-2]ERI37346.1 GntR family transcriptional regulator [Arthrobacter sp. AK-YN10]NKR12517.1 GntR family transcriptional regulator [Arthrobacter sp. M5]NKR17048.1 GntR family transcriptional regulator [Arthrobacter sp. M6]OEH61237.1 GntR family transcriptional regulator [Arthroba